MLYTKKVQEHFLKPHNMGEIKNADGVGEKGNKHCGDIMRLWIKVDPKSQKIKDIKFKTFGCAAAIATSSVTTDLAKGKTVDQAEKITHKQVIKSLGELPPVKVHCSLLAVDALRAAIKDYRKKCASARARAYKIKLSLP